MDRGAGGPDDIFSIEPNELKELCNNAYTAWTSLGDINYSRKDSELENLKFRRSLYFIKDLKKGDVISEENTKSIRPGYGLKPKFFDKIYGKPVNCDISRGTPVKKEFFDKIN